MQPASTEPRAFERGEIGATDEDDEPEQASTEPRAFERGEVTTHFFVLNAAKASTEPRAFERGERQAPSSKFTKASGFNGAARF